MYSCLSANCHERIHSRQTNVKGSRSFQSSPVSDDQKVKLPPNVLSWFGFPGIEVTTWIKELIGRDPADQGFEQEILWIDEAENMAEENSRNDSSSTTIASTVIALQFIAKSRKSAQRRDQAVVEQPAGAARGRNLRDAILKKEQVCFLLSLRCKDDDLQRI